MTADTPGRRPAFRTVQATGGHKSPEELFYRLSGRSASHGYLRGPQQDVLREYADAHANTVNIAFELPTGTGKTAVGLLVAEWKRTTGQRVAYLSLTNQLAGQVIAEAKRLGISVADLRGTKNTRNPAEEGRFRTRAAIGVTTYANLFNVHPVVRDCELLVCDDAHGAEQSVADMWTVSVKKADHPGVYASLIADLRASISESHLEAILEDSGRYEVDLADAVGHPECIEAVAATLDGVEIDSIKYPWSLLRANRRAALFLVSPGEVTIRPLVSPTHTHAPFADASQRIYMSATLGSESDLLAAYGVTSMKMIRAQSPQWGRRYIFVPGLYVDPERAVQATAAIWDGTQPKRAVLLSPSDRSMRDTYRSVATAAQKKPVQFKAEDIANSLDEFVSSDDALLTLAGRYDGLDLPDDQCRLLIMAESPRAINPLERYLSERWKLGPVLRKRERTRLVQGLGRCTRNATDFAVIVWLGQSLVDASTSTAILSEMPPEITREIAWGVEQSELAASDPDAFLEMALGLLEDANYRRGADGDIESQVKSHPVAKQAKHKDAEADTKQAAYEELGVHEVHYSRAMWDQDYERAVKSARLIVDQVTAPDLQGYRAWWWFLVSVAASRMGDDEIARDALARSAACGVNSGWIRRLLQARGMVDAELASVQTSGIEPNAQGVWDLLQTFGWTGPKFDSHIKTMSNQLEQQYHKAYHEGLEALGKCLGAQTTRSTEAGAPDVVWSFPNDVHFAFEAKTEKKATGTLSKSDLQQAKGHRDWVRERLCAGREAATITAIVVSENPDVQPPALPFAADVFHATPEMLRGWSENVVEVLREQRVRLSAQDFTAAGRRLSTALRAHAMDVESIAKHLMASPLKK